MKISLARLWASSLLLGVLCGCQPHKPGTPEPHAPLASAEKTSFAEVTAQLDPGGNLYAYLSTEQWLDGISTKMAGWQKTLASIPDTDAHDRDNLVKGFALATKLVHDSGVEDVSGVGISGIAIEPGLYRTKLFVHHYSGKGQGFGWSLLGGQPHPLTGLDLLPTNTVLALFSDTDVPQLWKVLQKEVAASDLPQAQEWLQQLPQQFEQQTQIKWDRLLASLGGEFGMAVTFDTAHPVTIPLPTSKPLDIPEPALLLMIKVKDDTIFDRVDAALKANDQISQQVESVNEGNLKMRSMAVPLPLPIRLHPAIATSDGYLFLASSEILIKQVLAVKAGKAPGLKSTADFARLSQNIPLTGNQFTYVSPQFGKTMQDIQQQAMEMNSQAPEQAWLKSVFQPGTAGCAFNVSSHMDSGWLALGNSTQHPATVMMLPAVAGVGMLSAIAIPNFVRAKATAQKNACINNLRQIDAAKQQWALENHKPETAVPTTADLEPYLPRHTLPTCPKDGAYTLGAVNETPTCSVAGHQIPNYDRE